MSVCCASGGKIELYEGDSLDIEFTITWACNSGAPVDLTLFNVRFVVFNTSINKSSEVAGEITITDATAGKATVHLKPDDTAGLKKKHNYTYDGEIYDASDVYTFAQGKFRVL